MGEQTLDKLMELEYHSMLTEGINFNKWHDRPHFL